MVAADAKALEGQTLAAQRLIEEAKLAYRAALMTQTGIGADRGAA
jgi:hypothetical protein